MSDLKYGGLPVDECEVIFRIDSRNQKIYVNSTWPKWSRRLEKRYGCPTKYIEKNDLIYSAFWILPLQSLSLRRIQPKRSGPVSQTGRFTSRTPSSVPVSGDKIRKGTHG